MEILNQKQILQKIKRLAIEILERNHDCTELYLAGINNNGLRFAKLLESELSSISRMNIHLINILLNPANPVSKSVEISVDIESLNDKVIIIVDDVANTGRTAFYAAKPLLNILPKKLEFVALVDRKHKTFPISPDYVGMSLATTMKENINVNLKELGFYSVELI
jgi:pyrimidine operon attenuation protein / uracil phosphoribosyltransferase